VSNGELDERRVLARQQQFSFYTGAGIGERQGWWPWNKNLPRSD